MILNIEKHLLIKIYVYDDEFTITFNVGENPLTVTRSLLKDIKSNLKNNISSYFEQCSPPKIESLSTFAQTLFTFESYYFRAFRDFMDF